jgi:hypothetical protein
MKKIEEPKKSDAEIIAEGLMESVGKTEQFLDTLRNIGRYSFREKIHLTDVELAKMLDENITAQLTAIRDYYLLFEFVKRKNLEDRFKTFRDGVLAEVMKQVKENPAEEEG